MEYVVTESDSIERIAAKHDCTVGELMKLNKLSGRYVFSGQKLIVPWPIDDGLVENTDSMKNADSPMVLARSENDGIRLYPGSAVPVHNRFPTVSEYKLEPQAQCAVVHRGFSEKSKSSDEEVDTDSLKKFIKLKVKQITDDHGTVPGTLLVTPNALMFDPSATHPLVTENGQEMYLIMARIEEVNSIALFTDEIAIASLQNQYKGMKSQEGETDRKADIDGSQPSNVITIAHKCKQSAHVQSRADSEKNDSNMPLENLEERKFSDSETLLRVKDSREGCKYDSQVEARRTKSDVDWDVDHAKASARTVRMPSSISESEKDCNKMSEFSSSQDNLLKKTPARGSLSRFTRTLSMRANNFRGSVASGAERVTQSAISSTKSVAHGVVSHGKVAADTLQTGIQNSAKMAASHAKIAVDAVAAVPHGIANISSGLFSESGFSNTSTVTQNEPPSIFVGRKRKLALLESLITKTEKLREEVLLNQKLSRYQILIF